MSNYTIMLLILIFSNVETFPYRIKLTELIRNKANENITDLVGFSTTCLVNETNENVDHPDADSQFTDCNPFLIICSLIEYPAKRHFECDVPHYPGYKDLRTCIVQEILNHETKSYLIACSIFHRLADHEPATDNGFNYMLWILLSCFIMTLIIALSFYCHFCIMKKKRKCDNIENGSFKDIEMK